MTNIFNQLKNFKIKQRDIDSFARYHYIDDNSQLMEIHDHKKASRKPYSNNILIYVNNQGKAMGYSLGSSIYVFGRSYRREKTTRKQMIAESSHIFWVNRPTQEKVLELRRERSRNYQYSTIEKSRETMIVKYHERLKNLYTKLNQDRFKTLQQKYIKEMRNEMLQKFDEILEKADGKDTVSWKVDYIKASNTKLKNLEKLMDGLKYSQNCDSIIEIANEIAEWRSH